MTHPHAGARALALASVLAVAARAHAQFPAPTPAQQAAMRAQADSTAADHRQMLAQLGISALRPGPSGNEQAPNHANYVEATANPFPGLPNVLQLKNGQLVKTPAQWAKRRAEIVDDFEREVYGRIPKNVPKVTWRVAETDTGTIGGRRVVGRQLVGHVDNGAYPAQTLDIPATLVLPADAAGPVPVMILFRGGTLAQALGRPGSGPGARGSGLSAPGGPSPEPRDPAATDQLIADGWGFVFLNPTSVQADNGAGLTRGIIGLTNKGQPRTPEQWGALRAWGWGASRVLDYLETDRAVNAKQVAVEGVSRYGKAALVAMAFDPRFGAVLIGSSGKGGATLHRRNWGEAVESLTGTGEYHWMAGNYLKYAAAEGTHGAGDASQLPVDSHELLALCAPRPTFVSYGIPEKGDAKWLDHEGSWMAAIAAQPVFRLLGAKDLGRSDDYTTERMPGVNVGLLDGQLAWRQHDGGHTDAPNVRYFLQWADRNFGRTYVPAPNTAGTRDSGLGSPGAQGPEPRVPSPGRAQPAWPADRPAPRTDANSMLAHQQLLAKKSQGQIDVYYEGDSITRRWGATDYPDFLANWRANFTGWNAADFGWGADRIENMLWRLDNGELDGVNPKVIVLLAGTNNLPGPLPEDDKVADITRGLKAMLDRFHAKAPNATVVVTGIFPRRGSAEMARTIVRVNENLARMADGKRVRYVNINDKLAGADGQPFDGLTMDGLHPTVKGYQIWADALKPILTELLGPPKATDQAPPPTGDPSAKKPAGGSAPATAALRLPKLFADGMVVQRGVATPVWGWAPPRAAVVATFHGSTQRAVADTAGRWRVSFPAAPAGGPFALDVTAGANHVTVRDVLVGDVWVASGQSNMEWPVQNVTDAKSVIAAAHDSALRQFKVPISWADRPEDDVAGGDWQPADPQHVGNFSGVAYFFAKELRTAEKIPIGIINTTWGGSAIETWLSAATQGMAPDSGGKLLAAEQRRLVALRDTIQSRVGVVPEHDPGLVNGTAVWADPALDDAAWKPISVPAMWESQGYADVDGIGWYRTSFTLTADEARQPVRLILGPIDDDDVTWVNGVEVGRTTGYTVPRTYTVPASALHAGANVLAVRVTDYSGGGGIGGGEPSPALEIGGVARPFPGPWKFRLGELSVRMDAQRTNKIPVITYNKMVNPLLPFPIKGVIWYQGESNTNNDAQARAYRAQFQSLITSWRGAWQGSARTFPFLWVQLPGYTRPDSVPSASGGGWALQRESMDAALTLPNTGRAVIIDLGGTTLLHPTNKQDPGHRLALVARKVAYGEPVIASGPTYRAHTVKGSEVVIQFDHTEGGLTARGPEGSPTTTVGGFALAGADHKWVWAQGRIAGTRVIVSDPRVPHPVAVRYAWANNPDKANLYNGEKLPAAPFRTDRW